MEFLAVLIILLVVVFFVSAPLRGSRADTPAEQAQSTEREAEIAELEAAREAKYREIRDADLDHRTGKLSDADYAEVDEGLRAEAVAILGALDRAQSRGASHAEPGMA